MDFSFSYAVFRYVKDAQKDLAVPVGVALWSADAKFVRFRLAEKSDKTARISKTEDLPYINLVERQLREWIDRQQLPYQKEQMSPESDDWWRQVRSLLIHKVRVSEPLPIDCRDPESELEPLFTSVVRQDGSRNKGKEMGESRWSRIGGSSRRSSEVFGPRLVKGPEEKILG